MRYLCFLLLSLLPLDQCMVPVFLPSPFAFPLFLVSRRLPANHIPSLISGWLWPPLGRRHEENRFLHRGGVDYCYLSMSTFILVVSREDSAPSRHFIFCVLILQLKLTNDSMEAIDNSVNT